MRWLYTRVHKQDVKGKYLILESVERGLIINLNNSVTCRQVQYFNNVTTDATHVLPAASFDVNAEDYAGKLSNNIKFTRINNGWKLFNHKSCNDAVFLAKHWLPRLICIYWIKLKKWIPNYSVLRPSEQSCQINLPRTYILTNNFGTRITSVLVLPTCFAWLRKRSIHFFQPANFYWCGKWFADL